MDEFLELSNLQKFDFGLVDPIDVELIPQGLKPKVLVPKRLLTSEHLMPILLNLKQFSREQWQSFMSWLEGEYARSQATPVKFFITSDTNVDNFSHHWCLMQVVQTSSKGKSWFRIHDPRVMHQLLRILNPLQRKRLFGRSRTFHYRLDKTWISADRSERSELNSCGLLSESRNWDWSRIERIGILNRALLIAGCPLKSTSLNILTEQLIERAMNNHGFSREADLVEFTARGLKTNLTYDEHPAVALAIKKKTESDESIDLTDSFALIDSHIWDALRPSHMPQ